MGRGLPGIEGRIGALLVASALWIGCAGDGGRIPVSTAFDPVVSFPAEATFVWDREHISLPDDPALSGLGIGQIVEEEAEAAFGARGYRHSTVPEADYLLSYHLRVDTFIAADRSSSTAGLSVLLVDRNGRRVWTGWGRAPFYRDATVEARRARLRQVFEDMLADFPPRQLPPK